MSRTIHGLSHKCLKAFRKQSASLTVYWIYVSRMNNEGVAWPSVAGLSKDTGWNKNTCLKARRHLIAIGALEKVEDYIRPEWSELDPNARSHKVNLDRSEYYRPTGYVLWNNQKLPMLYNGGDEKSDIDNQPTDVRRNSTSKPSDVLNGRTTKRSYDETVVRRNGGIELNSRIESDSISQLDSSENTNTPAPIGANGSKPTTQIADVKIKEPSKSKAAQPKKATKLSYPRDYKNWRWDHLEQFAQDNPDVNKLAAFYDQGMGRTLKNLPNAKTAQRCVEVYRELQRNAITPERFESLYKRALECQSSEFYKNKNIDIFWHMNDVLPRWLKAASTPELKLIEDDEPFEAIPFDVAVENFKKANREHYEQSKRSA